VSAIRILIVDDEPLVLSSLRRLLAREDFEVALAASGPEGLGLLEKGEFDLVLSDYKMPGMNGLEFLDQVRRRWPGPRRLMLTAQADPAQIAEALASGLLVRSMAKPWDNRALVEALRDAFGSRAPAGAPVA